MSEPLAWPVTFVAGEATPDAYRRDVGRTVDIGRTVYLPTPGRNCVFMGVPGHFVDQSHFEIHTVDMRSQPEKWLDEADAILRDEPKAGEAVGEVQRRLARAQLLILKAQSAAVRRTA